MWIVDWRCTGEGEKEEGMVFCSFPGKSWHCVYPVEFPSSREEEEEECYLLVHRDLSEVLILNFVHLVITASG